MRQANPDIRGQVGRDERRVVPGRSQGMLHGMNELAHVARPAACLQVVQEIRRDALGRENVQTALPGHEVATQPGDVTATLP